LPSLKIKINYKHKFKIFVEITMSQTEVEMSNQSEHVDQKPETFKKNTKRSKNRTNKKIETRSHRAGLQFPVGRVHRHLKQGRYAERIGEGAPVYLSAVLEYLTAEILEISGNIARDFKKQRIVPRHIQLAIRNDEELNNLLQHVVISYGGVIPNIHTYLLPKQKKSEKE
jgi:histone H2A